MPVDTSQVPFESQGGVYINTELYPEDSFGYREVPIIYKDIYGRKSRVEMKKLNHYEYEQWRNNNNV